MKPATLIDTLYRGSFRNAPIEGWKSNSAMRRALESARRFVLDDSMSAFMADLANESFLKAGRNNPTTLKLTDSIRVSSRLPHDSIWIEYGLRTYQERARIIRGKYMHEPVDDAPMREGWLIQQHPAIPTACIMHVFTQDDEFDDQGFNVWTFPFAYAWCNDDSPLPWRSILGHNDRNDTEFVVPSAFITGIPAYARDNVNCVLSSLIVDPWSKYNPKQLRYLMVEWAGVVRRVWALLATLDHLPLTHGEARTSKGFLAKGQIRKYLSHQTITLNVPARTDTRVLARKAIAHAHRRRHEVRGHFRSDWRHPPSATCDPHLWECVGDDTDLIECSTCHGRQIYIHKHERGSAQFGYVLHDYLVKHEVVS